MEATAIANANIALCKYRSKRDEFLILPNNGSISMTCDGLQTITTVEFSNKYSEDIVVSKDNELLKEKEKIIGHLNLTRGRAGIKLRAKVSSEAEGV